MKQGTIEIHGGGMLGLKTWVIGDIEPDDFREIIYNQISFDQIKAAVKVKYGAPHQLGNARTINCAIVNRRLIVL